MHKKLILALILFTLCMSGANARSDKKQQKLDNQQNGTSVGNDSAPCVSWISPLVKPRAVLLCIHGLGLYSGSYANFGRRLSRLGISVYAIDVRGFGSWMKNGGHEQVDFNACLNDVKTALISIRAANPGLPVFLLGESMGGAIALRAAALYPDLINGLISSVPAGERFKQKKTDLKVALEFLKGPNKQFDVGSSIVDQATNNPKLREDWANNPLDRMDLSPKELMQFQSFMNDNHDSAKKIVDLAVLMVEGNKDKLVKPEGTWELFNDIESEQKTFLAVPSEHLIYEEQQDKERIYDARIDRLTAAWIFSHMEEGANLPNYVASPAGRNPQLTGAVSKIVSGNYSQAESDLQTILQSEPFNGEAHYWLGVALFKSGDQAAAHREFVTSISLGNDSGHAKEANNYLLSMSSKNPVGESPNPVLAPENKLPRIPVRRADITQGTPTVLAFFAPWAEQCKQITPMFNQANSMFGRRLKLIKVNVDEQSSKALVKDFNVGPIPTFVFLTADGNRTKTTIGTSSFVDFAKNVSVLLP